ncbi:unnamed protein product [Kuraishia capsulata CBS 1993]|uniref:DUF3835 domain-containing protein n=1 Tax=Kuraishia capsulata CBS 1993 TaxID=1382522 RepID=W6MNT8_9ASCO|nr:uncharacterized protein KUCA_T00003923001 [Kuraishia capsulata CBS 1993]CDK27943.1 unnamed protein product [Kuraishia capsulata CBS 1993]
MESSDGLQLTLDHFKSNLANLKLAIQFCRFEKKQLEELLTTLERYREDNLQLQIQNHDDLQARSVGSINSPNQLTSIYEGQRVVLLKLLQNVDLKIESLEKEYNDKEESGGKIMDLLQSLQNFDMDHLSQDDQTMEIREELDDDDNVVSSKVEPYSPGHNEQGLPFMNIQETLEPEIATAEPEQAQTTSTRSAEDSALKGADSDEEVDEIEELLKDMGLTRKTEDSNASAISEISESHDSVLTKDLTPDVIEAFRNAGLDPQDALELELFMDDADDYDSGEEEYYVEPDEGYWHGGDSETIQERIAQELERKEAQAKPVPRETVTPRKPALKTSASPKLNKSVSFSDELDIKNVENISCPYYNGTGATTFSIMQNWLRSRNPDEDDEDEDEGTEETEDIEEIFGDEIDLNSLMSPVESLDTKATTEPLAIASKPKVSRFKQSRQSIEGHGLEFSNGDILEHVEDSSVVDVAMADTIVEHPVGDIIERFDIGQALNVDRGLNNTRSSLPTKSPEAPVIIPVPKDEIALFEPEVVDQTPDEAEDEERRKMFEEYTRGVYDDDIPSINKQTVIEELDDFEKVNKLIEESDAAARVEELGKEFEDEETHDDNDVMEDEIVEHFEDTIISDDEEDDIEVSMLMQDVSNSYHSLRRKIVLQQGGYKETDEELEKEPIDEFGNPIKVSRFRAALLGAQRNRV